MSANMEIVWTLVILAIIGFFWVFTPNCLGKSFAFPSIFGASVVGYISGRQESRNIRDCEGELPLAFGGFIHGWVGVIFAVPAIAIGWFLGVLVCVNVLPEFGDFRCITCLEASR